MVSGIELTVDDSYHTDKISAALTYEETSSTVLRIVLVKARRCLKLLSSFLNGDTLQLKVDNRNNFEPFLALQPNEQF